VKASYSALHPARSKSPGAANPNGARPGPGIFAFMDLLCIFSALRHALVRLSEKQIEAMRNYDIGSACTGPHLMDNSDVIS
jgi:hypothetical protein